MSKGNLLFLAVVFLLFAGFLSVLLTDIPDPSDCPAPENPESMEVYQMLNQSIAADTPPEEAVQAFLEMCNIPVDCTSDMILVEYHHWEESGTFNIHLARQFGFSDSLEYIQLHLDLDFSADETMELPRGSMWYENGSADLAKRILDSEGYLALEELMPQETTVSIGWTW